jgi:N-acetylneuraminate synthase
LAQLVNRYGAPVGLSDHSATIYAGLAAVALGAQLIEVHLTLSPDMFGPDVAASLTSGQLHQLVQGARFIAEAKRVELDKDAQAAELIDLRTTFGKSVVAARDLQAGAVLSADDLALKKPGVGLPAEALGEVVGRVTRIDLRRNTAILLEDLEPIT